MGPVLYEEIFFGTLSTCVLPVPEEATLLAAGYAARLGRIHLAGAVGAAWAAVLVGDSLGYGVGRFLLQALLGTPFGRRIVPERWLAWGQALVTRHGDRAVFLARFLVGLRGFVYFAVGAARYSYPRFLGVGALAAALEVGGLVGVGFAFGELRESHAAPGRTVDVALAVVLAATLFCPSVARAWATRRAGSTSSASATSRRDGPTGLRGKAPGREARRP